MKTREKCGIIKEVIVEEWRTLMSKINAFISASESVTEAVSSPALSADDVAVIAGIVLCLLFGFILSFFILAKIKRR